MPELPEVETIVRKLNAVLTNKVVRTVTVYRAKSFSGEARAVVDKPITKVSRRAKLIRFHFPDKVNILAHLKMTGQFIFVGQDRRVGGGHPTADWVNQLPSKHTRVAFTLDNQDKKEELFFNDMRVFGWLRVLSDSQVEQEYSKYGPDINTPEASLSYFQAKLAKTSRKIKQVIMDNKIIAGVGNIYACDGLNLAKIRPDRQANSLTSQEVKLLLASLKQVVELGITLGGATIDSYRNVDGFAGGYQDKVLVYGREGQSCYNCSGVIKKVKLGGRGTYFCPSCQL